MPVSYRPWCTTSGGRWRRAWWCSSTSTASRGSRRACPRTRPPRSGESPAWSRCSPIPCTSYTRRGRGTSCSRTPSRSTRLGARPEAQSPPPRRRRRLRLWTPSSGFSTPASGRSPRASTTPASGMSRANGRGSVWPEMTLTRPTATSESHIIMRET